MDQMQSSTIQNKGLCLQRLYIFDQFPLESPSQNYCFGCDKQSSTQSNPYLNHLENYIKEQDKFFKTEQIEQLDKSQTQNDEQEKSKRISTFDTIKHKIFQQKSSPKQKKNNLPKFFIRIFLKYFYMYKDIYGDNSLLLKNTLNKVYNLRKKLQQNKQLFIGLRHLDEFFALDAKTTQESKFNRRIMKKILQKNLRHEINNNSQIKSKIFSLRCLSVELVTRIQCS